MFKFEARISKHKTNSNFDIRISYLAIWILSFGIMLSGCATVYNPATGRNEYVFIDSMQEVQIGRSMSEEVIKKEYKPLQDAEKQLYVNKIGQRIAAVCDRKDIIYRFMVLDSPDYNAFALPGGYVYIYNGLLEKIDEAELAAVLAHEVGHITARHSVKKMQAVLGYDILLGLVAVGFGEKNPALVEQIPAVTNTIFELLSRGYSREDELLADKLAVKYTNASGYDAYGVVRMLEFLQTKSGPGGRVFEILSTHPRMSERVRLAKEEVGKLGKPSATKL